MCNRTLSELFTLVVVLHAPDGTRWNQFLSVKKFIRSVVWTKMRRPCVEVRWK